jgi:hypothetical protein
MGWDKTQITPRIVSLMSPQDQSSLDFSSAPNPELDLHPSGKRDVAEKKEQGSFANWILLQNSNGADIPFEWHTTKGRSKCTPGTPDFWVGVNGHSIWFEFKKDYTCKLSSEQELFRQRCEKQHLQMYVVYSAFEAIRIVEEARKLEQANPWDIA